MKTGIELIAEERQEQIEKHGRTILHDIKENNGGSLRYGAIAILTDDMGQFPADWEDAICKKILNKPYPERLKIAGALIAAELDRWNSLNNPIEGD